MVCYVLYFIDCILYTHICIIYIYNYMYIYIYTYMYILLYIYTHMYIFSAYYIYCRISHQSNSSPFVRRAPNEASQTPARGWSPEDRSNPPWGRWSPNCPPVFECGNCKNPMGLCVLANLSAKSNPVDHRQNPSVPHSCWMYIYIYIYSCISIYQIYSRTPV